MWWISLQSSILLTWSNTSDSVKCFETWRLSHNSGREPSSDQYAIIFLGRIGAALRWLVFKTCTIKRPTTLRSGHDYCLAQPVTTPNTYVEGDHYCSNSPRRGTNRSRRKFLHPKYPGTCPTRIEVNSSPPLYVLKLHLVD